MDKSKFSPDQLKNLLERPAKKEKWHSYKHKKTPRRPTSLGNPHSKKQLGKAKVILQKSPPISLEQLYCIPNQNYPFFFLDKLLTKKIKSLKAKERMIAQQNINRLSHQMQQWIYTQIQREVKSCQTEALEFTDLIEKREERHFRIDRIIKYLSDI